MTVVLAVYAAHTNWRAYVMTSPTEVTATKPLGLKYRYDDEVKKNQELTDKLQSLTDEKNKELEAKVQAIAKLRTEKKVMEDQLNGLQTEKDKLDKSQREAVAAMKATQEESAKFREEVTGLRTDAENAQKDRDEHFKEVVKLTDEMHQMVNEMTELKNRNTTLSADLAKAKEVLRHNDLNENMDIAGPPKNVEGLVQAVQGGGMLEISIGSDSGVQKGNKLDVYRVGASGNKYVGRIEVLKTAPDKSVCKIIPNFQQSEVQVGDRVASKID